MEQISLDEDLERQFQEILEMEQEEPLEKVEKFVIDPLIDMSFLDSFPSCSVPSTLPYIKITKFTEKPGTGHPAAWADKIVIWREERWPNGHLFDLDRKIRRTNRSILLQNAREPLYYQDCGKTLKSGEIAWFRLDFDSPPQNPYFNTP